MNKIDKNWEKFGEEDPYYWVTTLDKYRGHIDKSKIIKEFFEEGEIYIHKIIEIINSRLDSKFNPQSVLDFGCGVGRILMPLAKECRIAYGIDISTTMIERAKFHAKEEKVDNVKFFQTIDELNSQDIKFDFIHSNYVFQHISTKTGIEIFKKLLAYLTHNGVAVIQFTYSNDLSVKYKSIDWMKLNLPFALQMMNMIKGKKPNSPMMEMHNYPLNLIVRILQDLGVDHYYIRHTKDGPFRGVMLFIQPNNSESNFIDLGGIP